MQKHVGYTERTGEMEPKQNPKMATKEKVRLVIEREPNIRAAELAAEVGIHPQTARTWIKEHPEWNWQGGKKGRKVKAKPKLAENQQKRHWAPTKTECECTEIKLAAQRAGFQSCEYGQFLASINYEW